MSKLLSEQLKAVLEEKGCDIFPGMWWTVLYTEVKALEQQIEWQPITQAPKDTTDLLLWSEDWIDEDFNESGIREGYWNDDYGWVTAKWNPCQDCWDRRYQSEPSHFQLKVSPLKSKTG